MKRVAIYHRVSTSDQTTEPQRLELLAYCERRGWVNPREYSDKISGAKFTRFGIDLLMGDVRKGRIDVLLYVKLDRIGRSPAGRLQLHVLMEVAEFELALIRERTKAGLAVARANGKTLGRPRFVMSSKRAGILSAWRGMNEEARLSITALAKQLGCSVGTAHKLVKSVDSQSPT